MPSEKVLGSLGRFTWLTAVSISFSCPSGQLERVYSKQINMKEQANCPLKWVKRLVMETLDKLH